MIFVIYFRQLLSTSTVNFIIISLPPVYVYLDVRVEGNCKVRGYSPHNDHSHSDTNYKFRGPQDNLYF